MLWDENYLAPLTGPSFDSFPKHIDFFIYQLLRIWIIHARLVHNQRCISACTRGFPTMVTSRTSKVFGLTVPKRRWKRIECRTPRRTSFVVRRSRIWIDTYTSVGSRHVMSRSVYKVDCYCGGVSVHVKEKKISDRELGGEFQFQGL